MQSSLIDQIIDQAIQHQAAGRLREAERLYRQVLAADPRHAEANHNLGVLLLQLNRMQDALKHLKSALDAAPRDGQLWVSYIDALIHAGQYQDGRAVLETGRRRGLAGAAVDSLQRRIDALGPDVVRGFTDSERAVEPATAGAGQKQPSPEEKSQVIALRGEGRYDAAESLTRALASRFPADSWSWTSLAGLLRLQGRFEDALQAIRTAIRLAPEDPEGHLELGLVFERLGQLAEAEASYRRALALRGDWPAVLSNLGVALTYQGKVDEAETTFRRAIALEPAGSGAYVRLAIALRLQGKLDEAEAALRSALAVEPDNGTAHVNLAGILRETDRLAEAEQSLRRAIERFPLLTEVRSNLLFSLNYSAAHSPQHCLEEARRYGEVVRSQVSKPFSAWTCTDPPTRLRIGFLSGDIHSHPVGFFLEGVLGRLDRSRVELFAYPTSPRADALTERVQPYFAAWHPVSELSDAAAAHRIHRDGIHILIELSGHTPHNRLPVLAWKPAPIQVSWLGYFATTGVKEVDYFLADEASVPLEHQSHFTECIWYLPDTRLCFTPPDSSVPVLPLPARTNGAITFGSFQNLAKLSDRTLALWGRVLEAVPGSRLRIQSPRLANEARREQLTARLRSFGIGAQRVSLHGPVNRPAYLAAYAEVDIILDTMPFPGGTTTCEALWMGVPTLTIAGDRLISRQGASLMRAAGLPEWVAEDEDTFVAKAAAFASGRGALGELRAGLRARLPGTPLFNAGRFAGNLESALWQMWQRRRQDR